MSRKKRKRGRGRVLILVVLLALIVFGVFARGIFTSGKTTTEHAQRELHTYAEQHETSLADYPDALVQLYARNPDARDFVRDYPKVELEISEMITSDIVEALKRDRIDAALVASGTCGEGIVEHELFSDRFYAYVSPANPLYERQNIRIEEIDLRELVLLSPGNCMRDQIIELCQAKREVPSHYSFESGSLDTLMRIVDCTHCLTIIPEMAVEYIPEEHRNQLKTLAKGATSRKIAVAVRRTYVKSSIIRALTQTILDNARR